MPISESRRQEVLGQTGRAGSRGGAPIWAMREAWMPGFNCHCDTAARADCPAHAGADRLKSALRGKRAAEGGRWGPPRTPQDGLGALGRLSRRTGIGLGADPDGFAVFGRYPKGFLAHILKQRLLGDVRRDEILHVCSGTLSDTETWTVDLRAEARPRVQASGTALPFRDASFRAVMLDPPYSDEYARNLYQVANPRPSWLLREAARAVVPGGRIGILHVAVPFSPPGCRLVNVWGISTGVGFRIRALTVYERGQDELLPAPPRPPGRAAGVREGNRRDV